MLCPGLLDRSEGEDLLESERKADIDLTPRVKVKELLASWNNDQHKTVLNDISFEVNKVGNVVFFSVHMCATLFV